MRKNQIRNVIVHTADQLNCHALAGRVSQFHCDIIERRLSQSDLSAAQKIKVVDNIIADLKRREVKGIIK